jgi:AcrR family transcriptional regulator
MMDSNCKASPVRIAPRKRGRPSRAESDGIEARVVEFARAELIRHGYGQASLTSVARAAGITKMTLYRKFPDKAALFRAVVNASVDHFETAFELDVEPEIETTLMTIGRRILEEWDEPLIEIMRLVFAEARRFPELSRIISDLKAETRTAVMPALAVFAQAGVDLQAAAENFLQLIFLVPNEHLLMGGADRYDDGTKEKNLRTAVRIFVRSWQEVFSTT